MPDQDQHEEHQAHEGIAPSAAPSLASAPVADTSGPWKLLADAAEGPAGKIIAVATADMVAAWGAYARLATQAEAAIAGLFPLQEV